jgi:two-component system LytT family response regulator
MTETDRVKVLVIDDETLGRKKISRMLKDDPEIELAGEYAGGAEAITMIRTTRPDLLFLDINMPEMDGFRLLDEIDEARMPFVIFVTAYDEYAVKAFQVHAIDYLLKPFDGERFHDALSRAKERIRQSRSADINNSLRSLLHTSSVNNSPVERFMVKSNGSISFLRAEEIDWIEAQGAYVCLYAHGKKHLVREKIGDIESQVAQKQFVRIHRSTIVNVNRIKEMQPLFYGEYAVFLNDGTRLTMSRSFRERVFLQLTRAS